MQLKTIFIVAVCVVVFGLQQALTCTVTGGDCKYNNECCSGACSAAFGFCLHR
ncbi:CTL [Operophtera brumata nucleopolyhedrovirus]|uniref:CTL n=1 Tax=Operophtera brumata nucleopolyhedrovirus TaxID=1046267 RepID=A0A2H4UZS7_9ABAC|nr:CTL [Operophtera brumata nucleopolyhedrovirus]AUA60265.1 CTL [Operophtera brumata nucleopolyhedrovirus]